MATRVLVVDSDEVTREIVTTVIETRYPDVSLHQAQDGEEALDFLVENGDYVDSILMGTEMPVTNGWELLHIVKDEDNWPEISVVMMIGQRDLWDDTLKAHTIGANHFVSKPISNAELLSVLDELLENN